MRYSSRRKASISKPHRSKRLRALVGAQDAQHDLARTALPGLLDRGLDETSTHPTALVVRVDGETGDLQDVRPGRREVRQPEEADEPALDITRLGDEHVARAGAVAEEVVAGVAQGRDGRAARGPRRQVDPPKHHGVLDLGPANGDHPRHRASKRPLSGRCVNHDIITTAERLGARHVAPTTTPRIRAG